MKFIVTLEVEVENSTKESEGKRAAYELASTLNQAKLNQAKRGRPPSGPRASLTGIVVTSAMESGPLTEMSKQVME